MSEDSAVLAWVETTRGSGLDESFDGKFTITRTFRAEVNDPSVALQLLREYENAPAFMSTHPQDSNALLKSKGYQPVDEEQCFWDVTCRYERNSTLGGLQWGDSIEFPWQLEPTTGLSSESVQDQLAKAYSKKLSNSDEWAPLREGTSEGAPPLPRYPIVNTAGDAFLDPLYEERKLPVLTIAKNVKASDISPPSLLGFQETINAGAISLAGSTVPAYCAWMRRVTISETKWFRDIPWYVITYEIVIDSKPICRRLANVGLYQKQQTAETTKNVRIKDAEGREVQAPVWLDERGLPLSDSEITEGEGEEGEEEEDRFLYVEYMTKPPVDWSSLDLPASLTGMSSLEEEEAESEGASE